MDVQLYRERPGGLEMDRERPQSPNHLCGMESGVADSVKGSDPEKPSGGAALGRTGDGGRPQLRDTPNG